MSTKKPAIETTLRIPGAWGSFEEISDRLPKGYSMCEEGLAMPDGHVIEMFPMKPDKKFAGIFESSCRRPATADELAIVNRYTVNLGLIGPGGSMKAAQTMMKAGAAIVQTGAAGVFIDNSMLAHGATLWTEISTVCDIEAISFAFVGVIRGKSEVRTMGMNVLGKPDLTMSRQDFNENTDSMIDLIRYVCSTEKPIGDRHIIAMEMGAQFQSRIVDTDDAPVGSHLHNPFGRLQLVNLKAIGESN
ncbi:MAG: hypothetical protein NTW52_13745 [Planctomycetota bacterium]|nr:hypothetical protein [Planctomycetota bacterium]